MQQLSERLSGVELAERGELTEARLLTEVDHFLDDLLGYGQVRDETATEVAKNLNSAVQEAAMPDAVTETEHEAVEAIDQEGRRRHNLMWLGKTAVQHADNGRLFHFSEPGLARVGVEKAEANYNELTLRTGIAQSMWSLRMPEHDGSAEIAKREHVHDDDSIRVSFPVADANGRLVARKMQSLLVRDIPLDAWVAMLKNPNNIFGKTFDIRDERSALAVMELFSQMDLPEDKLPEGPVTYVAEVLPYIKDNDAHHSVERQLAGFRGDQSAYKRVAAEKAAQWLEFEKELATSLFTGQATCEPRRLINKLAGNWSDEDLAFIELHEADDGGYRMTRGLAAMLEKAYQNILHNKAAILTGNEYVLDQMAPEKRKQILEELQFVEVLRSAGVDEGEIRARESRLDRDIADQNLTVGGGCMGENDSNFRKPNGKDGSGADLINGDNIAEAAGNKSENSEDTGKWKWTVGLCRIKACPSRPDATKIGPCKVCVGCQHIYDSGGDPLKDYQSAPKPKPKQAKPVGAAALGMGSSDSFESLINYNYGESSVSQNSKDKAEEKF